MAYESLAALVAQIDTMRSGMRTVASLLDKAEWQLSLNETRNAQVQIDTARRAMRNAAIVWRNVR